MLTLWDCPYGIPSTHSASLNPYPILTWIPIMDYYLSHCNPNTKVISTDVEVLRIVYTYLNAPVPRISLLPLFSLFHPFCPSPACVHFYDYLCTFLRILCNTFQVTSFSCILHLACIVVLCLQLYPSGSRRIGVGTIIA